MTMNFFSLFRRMFLPVGRATSVDRRGAARRISSERPMPTVARRSRISTFGFVEKIRPKFRNVDHQDDGRHAEHHPTLREVQVHLATRDETEEENCLGCLESNTTFIVPITKMCSAEITPVAFL